MISSENLSPFFISLKTINITTARPKQKPKIARIIQARMALLFGLKTPKTRITLIKIIKIPSAILVCPCSSLVFAPKHSSKLIRTSTIDKTFAYFKELPCMDHILEQTEMENHSYNIYSLQKTFFYHYAQNTCNKIILGFTAAW